MTNQVDMIKGVQISNLKIFKDNRGALSEIQTKRQGFNCNFEPVQQMLSISKKGSK